MCASKPQGAAAYVESSLLRLTAVDFDVLRLPVVVFYTLRLAVAGRGRPWQAVEAVAGRGRPWQAVAGRGQPHVSMRFNALLEYNL